MALIEKIRRQGWLIVGVIGICMLSFLVPYQAVIALLNIGNDELGSIRGETVSRREWSDAVERQKVLFNYSGNESSLSNDTWNNLVESKLFTSVFEKLGLVVTEDEFDEIVFGEMLSPYVKTTIYGGKDSTAMKEQMRLNFDGMTSLMYTGWKQLITLKRQREKFDLMVKKGVYANAVDGKWAFQQQNNKVNVDYVVKTYAEIPDTSVTWTESDIRAAFNKHKKEKQYKQESSRSIEYIKFPVAASSLDSTAARNGLMELTESFRTSTTDSLFAASKTSTPGAGPRPYVAGSVAEPSNTAILNNTVGDVVGPYLESGFMKISKITKRVSEIDSVQARHILFKEKGDVAKAKADSLKKVIVKQKNFAEMAAIYGTDGTKDSGGDLGKFGGGSMVAPFEKACFDGKVGEVQIVETSFGIHLVEVTQKNAPKMVTYLATIDRQIAPSSATRKSAYSMVNDFTISFSDSASFRQAADTLNGGTTITPAKNIRSNATTIPGLTGADEIIRWTYTAKVGDVSQPMMAGDEWVVAVLTEIKERGVPSFENIYDQMKAKVIKDKKAEKYAEIMNSGTLAEIATAVGSTTKQGSNITLKSNNIPGSGVSMAENALIGACFGIKKDFISSPIKGDGGVYVIQRTADIIETESQDNYLTDRDNMAKSLQSRAAMSIFNSFRENGEVEDNRFEQN